MTSSVLELHARAQGVAVTDEELIVTLTDGRVLSVPLAWFPRLLGASVDDRNDWQLLGAGEGIHWPQLDEDLSVAGLLRGVRPRSAPDRAAGASRR